VDADDRRSSGKLGHGGQGPAGCRSGIPAGGLPGTAANLYRYRRYQLSPRVRPGAEISTAAPGDSPGPDPSNDAPGYPRSPRPCRRGRHLRQRNPSERLAVAGRILAKLLPGPGLEPRALLVEHGAEPLELFALPPRSPSAPGIACCFRNAHPEDLAATVIALGRAGGLLERRDTVSLRRVPGDDRRSPGAARATGCRRTARKEL